MGKGSRLELKGDGTVTLYPRNRACTTTILGTFDEKSRHPGSTTRREKERGEEGDRGVFIGGFTWGRGLGFGEGRRSTARRAPCWGRASARGRRGV
jgi:hypothetical protein